MVVFGGVIVFVTLADSEPLYDGLGVREIVICAEPLTVVVNEALVLPEGVAVRLMVLETDELFVVEKERDAVRESEPESKAENDNEL